MPEASTIRRARKAKRQGKAPSTQAGEFVREEIHHVREGKHGARSPEQAIAIGLSKARRSGVEVGEPRGGIRSSRKTGKKASSKAAVSRASLASHARAAAKRRSPADRSRAAKKAARTRARRQSSGAHGSRATRRAS